MKNDLKSNDPLDPTLTLLKNYADNKAQTEETKELLLETIAYSIFVYMASRIAMDDIEKRLTALSHLEKVTSKDYLMVKSQVGDKTAVQIFPKIFLEKEKLENDEAIIEFVKKLPNFSKEEKEGSFTILRDEDFDREYVKSKEMATEYIMARKNTEDENE